MRALVAPLLAVLILAGFGSGCVSAEARRQAQVNEAACIRFVLLLDSSQTTRDQEQAFIKAQAKLATSFRESLGAEAVK